MQSEVAHGKAGLIMAQGYKPPLHLPCAVINHTLVQSGAERSYVGQSKARQGN